MRGLRIPGLIDMLSVSRPELIRSLAANSDLDREAEGGPLVSRLVRRQLASTLKAPEGPLPSALPRDSQERAEMRAALNSQLEADDLDTRLAVVVADCADYVSSGKGKPEHLAQTLFGRIFVRDFNADGQTWQAAAILDRRLGGPSPRGILDGLTGRLAQAQRTLSRAMKGDRNGVHAIGIAVHNQVKSLKAMRTLDMATPADKAIALTLSVPDRVARHGVSKSETVAAGIRPGTLVLLQTGKAYTRSLDPRDGFLHGSWSGCPAHAFVPRILRRIWIEAGGAS